MKTSTDQGVIAPIHPSPAPDTPKWGAADALAAAKEGWGLFDTSDSANGPWQVQAFDDPEAATAQFGVTVPKLDGDDLAWRLVFHGKAAHHAAARAFLAAHNPIELASIEKVGVALGEYQRIATTDPKPCRSGPHADSEAQHPKVERSVPKPPPMAETISKAAAALAHPKGRVLLTSCLGIDLTDCDREVTFCTLTADGNLSLVEISAGSEWDIHLLAFAALKPSIAVIEIEADEVLSMHSRLKESLASGMPPADAVAMLSR
ncbi:MAG: hypothetical protein B7X51_00815 [Pseudomonas sp. 34-62-33]|nr:MAG: hypothetical protein B7X51_00815 [Pseudomonas sp. 34-62-33]